MNEMSAVDYFIQEAVDAADRLDCDGRPTLEQMFQCLFGLDGIKRMVKALAKQHYDDLDKGLVPGAQMAFDTGTRKLQAHSAAKEAIRKSAATSFDTYLRRSKPNGWRFRYSIEGRWTRIEKVTPSLCAAEIEDRTSDIAGRSEARRRWIKLRNLMVERNMEHPDDELLDQAAEA